MSRRSRKWNFSSFDSVAVKSFTGTETRPNETDPVQIERGMPSFCPQSHAVETGGQQGEV
jgi:hypothetical protein